MVGAQRPVPDVVTAAHQVSAVSVVVDAEPVFPRAGPRSRDLCGGLAICLVVIIVALAVIVRADWSRWCWCCAGGSRPEALT
jgi:hypothetical protein